jgi:HAD superfamily hydrolase (TIGR01509 family)
MLPSATGHPLVAATHVVFDFDGPLCRLFAGPPAGEGSIAPVIARRLRRLLTSEPALYDAVRPDDDLFDIYRRISSTLHRDDEPEHPLVAVARKYLEEQEIAAAATAVPTPGAAELLERLARSGRRLSVASNNSESAVRAFLERTGLQDRFSGIIVGRAQDPRLMKPDPYPLMRVLGDHGTARPDRCVLVGDAVTDAQAAAAAGMDFVGYHRDPAKRDRLRAEPGVRHVVGRLQELSALLPA